MALASIRALLLNAGSKLFVNDGGNLTVVLALTAIPALTVVSAAFDYARITRDQTAFQAAVDSAALAVATSDRAALGGLSTDQAAARITELKQFARGYIQRNYVPQFKGDAEFSVSLAIDGQKVSLSATHDTPTTMLGAFGIQGPTMTVEAVVEKAARPVELVMVMDTTGSMGTTYMGQAKTAAKNLLTKLYGGDKTVRPESPYIRVGLVPFSGAVRLNTSAYDFDWSWIDRTGASSVSKLNFSNSTWHNYLAWTKLTSQPWNGCIEARPRGSAPYDYNTNDAEPTSGNSLFVPYFAPDEPTFSGSTSSGFYNSYISNSGTPNEQTGLASTSTASSNWLNRQNNVNKYVNKTITSEGSSDYGPWFNCAKSKIVPLTYKRANVESGIDAMTASGSTVIPEGLAWGWRALSPTAPFTKVEAGPSVPADTISPYHDVRWQKILVLMTDGENDVLSNGNEVNTLNGTWYSSYGRVKAATGNRFGTTSSSSANGALDTAMSTLCTNAKNAGITIYTVAFRVSSSSITNRLKACATDESHYSYAADGVALAAIFNHIGENVANTHIYLSK